MPLLTGYRHEKAVFLRACLEKIIRFDAQRERESRDAPSWRNRSRSTSRQMGPTPIATGPLRIQFLPTRGRQLGPIPRLGFDSGLPRAITP